MKMIQRRCQMENGYDDKIWVGDHTVSSDDTYEEIANKLMGKQ